MPFDTMALAAVVDEVQPLVGGHIQRVIQPSETSIALGIYAGSERQWLLMSADARRARVQRVVGPLAKAFPTPSSFVMLLRKYLDGRRVAALGQTRYERILTLEAGADERAVRLVAELMGKHSNVILVDHAGIVLGAFKIVPERLSRARPILPGRRYAPPPGQGRDERIFDPGPRVDPLASASEFARGLASAVPGSKVSTALLGLLPGCSPFMAEQIARRAGLAADGLVAQVDPIRLTEAATGLYALFDSRDWNPCTFRASKLACDFAPYRPLGADDVSPAPAMSAAVERCVGRVENVDPLASTRRNVLVEVDRARRRVEGRLESLRDGLAAAGDAERSRTDGQLILAYQHLLELGAHSLHIPDLEETIQLDPRRSPQENAERQFRRYRKLRDARQRIPTLLAAAEIEEARLDELRVFVTLAEDERQLQSLRADIDPDRRPADASRGRKSSPAGPPRFRLGPFIALVGRNARENEQVTFRLAGRRDLWLHARGRTGAHVVLEGADPPPEIVAAAASLAAYHSEGRTEGAVDVDVAPARNVRKIPGGPPGRVTYRDHQTVRVAPGVGEWRRV